MKEPGNTKIASAGGTSRICHGIVHWADDRVAYASIGNKIFQSDSQGARWSLVGRLPISHRQRVLGAHSLGRRLLRWGVYHLRPLGDGKLVVCGYGRFFLLDCASGACTATTTITGSRPLALCLKEGALYYGEYVGNNERRPVRVFVSRDGSRSWDVAWTFSGVRHIHGIYEDPHTGWIWVTTGDSDEESALWVTRDGFTSVEKVFGGGQQRRVIKLVFAKEWIYFGSDAVEEENHLYRLRRDTGQVETLAAVGGGVFHGVMTAAGLFFSTVCEESSVNRDRDCTVWHSPDGTKWTPLLKFRKDLWPKKLFQYGQVFFAEGQAGLDGIWVTPFAARHSMKSVYYDHDTVRRIRQGDASHVL